MEKHWFFVSNMINHILILLRNFNLLSIYQTVKQNTVSTHLFNLFILFVTIYFFFFFSITEHLGPLLSLPSSATSLYYIHANLIWSQLLYASFNYIKSPLLRSTTWSFSILVVHKYGLDNTVVGSPDVTCPFQCCSF